MTVSFMFNFRNISNKFPMIFQSLIFRISVPSQPIFCRKRKPKIFGFKNAMERGIRKILTFVKLKIASKIFGEIIIVISKRLKLPQDNRTDTNFIAPLRMHFQRSDSTLDGLKSVFNAFRRKPSLGAPESVAQ